MEGLLFVGCLLFVVGCWLLVVGCWLFVVCCLLLVVGYWLLVVGCLLFVVGCLLFVVCCLLIICCLLFVGVFVVVVVVAVAVVVVVSLFPLKRGEVDDAAFMSVGCLSRLGQSVMLPLANISVEQVPRAEILNVTDDQQASVVIAGRHKLIAENRVHRRSSLSSSSSSSSLFTVHLHRACIRIVKKN